MGEASAAARDHRKTYRDEAVRRLRFLKHAQKLGMHSRDWMMTKVATRYEKKAANFLAFAWVAAVVVMLK